VNPAKVQHVSDLRDDDSIYSTEKALLLMFDKSVIISFYLAYFPHLRNRGIDNFRGSGIEKSTESSKEAVLRRVACIETVHNIRCILAKECFIGGAEMGSTPISPGLVGLQDSGKTTLLNRLWGLQGNTGLFAHTDVPVMHRITSKVMALRKKR
jgi:hypothetical protein